MPGKIMIVAGEASGDAHGAALVREMRARDPGLEFYGLGGERLAGAGVRLVGDVSDFNVMGFLEVVPSAGRIWRTWRKLRSGVVDGRPDLLVIIDWPEINLRLARVARRAGIKVCYYVAPQVWAWRTHRVRQIRDYCDQVTVIFPFEPEFFARHGVEVFYGGHPFADLPEISPAETAAFRAGLGLVEGEAVVGLLPGSRRNEIRHHLPLMARAGVELSRKRPGTRFLLPAAPGLDPEDLRAGLAAEGLEGVAVVSGQTRQALAACRAAWVCSGTATLEAAHLRTPLVVVYRGGFLGYCLARLLINDIGHIGMPNLVAGRTVASELIQGQATPARLVEEMLPLLEEGPRRAEMLAGLDEIRERLGLPGVVARAAARVLDAIKR